MQHPSKIPFAIFSCSKKRYVSKFYQLTRVIAKKNIHNGNVEVGERFLHNTKITTSQINKERAHQTSRNKDKPSCRDYLMMEIYQILLCLADWINNLEFIQISSMSFEVQAKHLIELKTEDGSVVGSGDTDDVDSGNSRPHSRRRNNGVPNNAMNLSDNVDAHMSGLNSVRVRELSDLDLHPVQRVTRNQEIIARDRNGKFRWYDQISIFGLRPSELTYVALNP